MAGSSVNNLKSIRMLTEEERKSVESYLSITCGQSSGKKSHLVSREVMSISGECVKQTEFSPSENTYFYKIHNIDIVFPFNMDRYLSDYNEVEIALTQNFAIAVKLNDHKIGSALYATYLADEKNEKQSSVYWLSGASKFSKGENLDENIKHTVIPHPKLSEKLGYEILSVRKETSQESASRNKLNRGILTAFFCFFVVSYFNRFWDTKELNDLFWFGVNFLAAGSATLNHTTFLRGKVNLSQLKKEQI